MPLFSIRFSNPEMDLPSFAYTKELVDSVEYLLYSDAIHCLVWSCLYSSSEQAEQNESCQGRFSSDVFHLPHE